MSEPTESEALEKLKNLDPTLYSLIELLISLKSAPQLLEGIPDKTRKKLEEAQKRITKETENQLTNLSDLPTTEDLLKILSGIIHKETPQEIKEEIGQEEFDKLTKTTIDFLSLFWEIVTNSLEFSKIKEEIEKTEGTTIQKQNIKEKLAKLESKKNEVIQKFGSLSVDLSPTSYQPRKPETTSPFKNNGLAPFASSAPAFGAIRALLKVKEWTMDDEGRPCFVHAINGEKLKGKISYHVILPKDPTAEQVLKAQKEIAWDLVKNFGIDTAWIHLLLLSYAATTTKESRNFCIPRVEIYRCLGLDKRTDLTRKDKDSRCFEILKQLQSIGLNVINLRLIDTKPKGRKIPFEYEKGLYPLWDIYPREYGQGTFDTTEGKITYRYEEWQVVGREGLWGNTFLHGEPSLRQFGYLSREMLEKVKRQRNSISATLAVLLTFKNRFEYGNNLKISNQEIIEFSGRETHPEDRRKRGEIKNQVINAILEQEKWGWKIKFNSWPELLRPQKEKDRHIARIPYKKWDEFLHCETAFIPPQPLKEVSQTIKFLPPNLEKNKDKKTWTGEEIRELRQSLGWTAKQLGNYLKVSLSMISRLESNERVAKPEYKRKFSFLEREKGKGK